MSALKGSDDPSRPTRSDDDQITQRKEARRALLRNFSDGPLHWSIPSMLAAVGLSRLVTLPLTYHPHLTLAGMVLQFVGAMLGTSGFIGNRTWERLGRATSRRALMVVPDAAPGPPTELSKRADRAFMKAVGGTLIALVIVLALSQLNVSIGIQSWVLLPIVLWALVFVLIGVWRYTKAMVLNVVSVIVGIAVFFKHARPTPSTTLSGLGMYLSESETAAAVGCGCFLIGTLVLIIQTAT